MTNGNALSPSPEPEKENEKRSTAMEGARLAFAFLIVLLTFGVFVWLMYEAIVNNNNGAYCKVEAFFPWLCLLAFSVLGIVLGGWAEATWHLPKGSLFGRLATKAGGGAAFFLIAAAVIFIFANRVDCPQALAYSLSFEKPLEVPIGPDRDVDDWYQHYPYQARVARGILLYSTGPDAMGDAYQDISFKLDLGKPGTVLCPIHIRFYNNRRAFRADCRDSQAVDSLAFKLSDDLIAYASRLVAQSANHAPVEAAGVELAEPVETECFSEIRASDQRIGTPYNQTFRNDGRNLSAGPHVTVHLYKGEICIKSGNETSLLPVPRTSGLTLEFPWTRLVGHFVSPAFAGADQCDDTSPLQATLFEDLLKSLASEEPEDAIASLVANFRIYECKIYDALLRRIGPNVASRLLKVIVLAPVGWSNIRLIANDAFPDLRPNDKAKSVFDRAIEEFILSDNDELRRQARKLLTVYPAKYVREKFAETDIDQLSELQQFYFSYAGTFLYFRPVISGEHFDTKAIDANPDLMPKVIAEHGKGIALRRYLDRQDLVDSYVLDFGLASSVRNFEKSRKGALVPDRYKPSQKLFRTFLDNVRAAPEAYPFNNQLGWATCFAYASPTKSLRSGPQNAPLTLDDAEWFKGESIDVSDSDYVLSGDGPTVLKACPGSGYQDTDWTVESGDKVRRLLRKMDGEDSWLFIRAHKGFGWLRERPKEVAKGA